MKKRGDEACRHGREGGGRESGEGGGNNFDLTFLNFFANVKFLPNFRSSKILLVTRVGVTCVMQMH
jgi:hypothetical protein